MSLNYTENRIKEALRTNGGSAAKAKRQLFSWLYEDHKLLLDITQPHLNGIVAYAVDRVLCRTTKTDEEMFEEEAETAALSTSSKDTLGKDILKGFIAKDVTHFGQESYGIPVRKKAASQKHIDAMHMLAAKSRQKLSGLEEE